MSKKKTKKNTQERRLEFLGLLLIIFGVLVLLSLVSYKTTDWPNSSNPDQMQNWMGLAGAWLASNLFNFTIGYPILVLPFLIMYLGLILVRRGSWSLFFRRSGYVLFFALCFSIAFALPRAIQKSSSFTHEFNGSIGLFFAQTLFNYLGPIGSVLILFIAMLIAFLSVTEISIISIFRNINNELRNLWSKITSYLASLWQRRSLHRSIKSKEKNIAKEKIEKKPHVSDYVSSQPRAKTEQAETETVQDLIQAPVGKPAVEKPEIEPNATKPDSEEDVAFDFEEPIEGTSIDRPDMGDSSISSPPIEVKIPENYKLPSLDLLDEPPVVDREKVKSELLQEARLLEEKLAIYNIEGKVVQIHPGPLITQFEVEPAEGVKISKFFSIADDLAMVMRAPQIRILAPIPGKPVVGIEIPNRNQQLISLLQVIDTEQFRNANYQLPIALGVDTTGKPYITDLIKMPHLLIAGSTGSGKSVCLNTIISSLLFQRTPRDLRLILIDPKKLELSGFADLRNHHLISLKELNEDVITTPDNAITILGRVWQEMERRFNILASAGVRTLEDYNNKVVSGELEERHPNKSFERIPYCVVIIDELADLLLASTQDVEEPIGRLAHKARAVGIHLIVATQRPSTDVITGAIKANFPCRIAFKVFSKTDSRVVLDFNGAEKLLGRGDMLFQPPGQPQPIRLHAPFMSDEESRRIVKFVKSQPKFPKFQLPEMIGSSVIMETADGRKISQQRDPLFNEALKLVVRHNQGSISLLQRRLRVGYARAARLIDELEMAGFVGVPDGSKAREVLVSEDEIEEMGIV